MPKKSRKTKSPKGGAAKAKGRKSPQGAKAVKKAPAVVKPIVKNSALGNSGVMRLSRSALRSKRATKGLNFSAAKFSKIKFPTTKAKASPVVPEAGIGRFYATEDAGKPLNSTKKKQNAVKVRASITPGTVLILLAGKHAAKRVVCLGVLPSGLLLVTGPYKFNGVPVRRVNQSFVIATGTSVSVAGVNVSKFDDKFFDDERKAAAKAKSGSEAFFEGDEAAAHVVTEERKADQEKVDSALIKAASMKKGSDIKMYLRATFSLSKGQYPHLMKF